MSKAKSAYLEALASDPFDEEIHLALLRIYGATGSKALAQRARDASVQLTGLSAEKIDRIAASFGREDRSLAEGIPNDGARQASAQAAAVPDAGR